MLVIEVREPGQPARTRSFTRHTLSLGRELPQLTIADDVPLAGNVQSRHIELFERDGLLRLRAYGPTTLDGEPCPRVPNDEQPIKLGSVLVMAGVTVRIVEFTPIVPPDFDVREAEFLRAIQADPSSIGEWLVYADALEERDYLIRAEYLRLEVRRVLRQEMEGDSGARERYQKNLKAAALWLGKVRVPTIARGQGCPAKLEGDACPIAWTGDGNSVSVCPKCQHAVYYPPRA